MAQAFTKHSAKVAPMDRGDVDTDLIIPKQFLKRVERSGYGIYLFDALRYLDEGRLDQDCSKRPLNKDFALNKPAYQNSTILLTRANFGCGSSREHAVWALDDYGIRCIIAPSFADIFYNNCSKNGVLPVVLSSEQVDQLFVELYASDNYVLTVDLPKQSVTTPSGEVMLFDIESSYKYCLSTGLDDIGLTLDECSAAITDFEQGHTLRYPWLYR